MVFKKDKILSNFYIHGFIITLIIICYLLIVFYNYNSFMNSLKNRNIIILPNLGNCDYKDLNLIPDKNKCTKTNDFYITIEGLTYTLQTDDTNYLSICKDLCTSFDATSPTPCKGNSVQLEKYKTCQETLKPFGSCREISRPLGYRIGSTSNQRVAYFAKKIIDINNCL